MSDYIKNAGWIFTEKLVRITVGFILFALVSRVLGPTEFGLLSYYQTLAIMFLAVTSLGFDNVLINEFNNRTDHNEIFSTAFWSRVGCSAVVLLFFIIGLSLENMPTGNKIVLLLCLASLLFQSQNTYISFYQSRLLASLITKISLFSLLISSSFKVYLLYTNASIKWFAFSYTIDFAVSFFLIVVFSYKKNYVSINIGFFKFETLIRLLKLSWPIIVSSVIIVLYTRLDQIMIMKMLGPDAVATFSVAVRISEAYVFVPAALVTSYYPLISRMPNRDNVKFYFDVVFFSSFVMALGVAIVSYFIIPVMFGEVYANSHDTLMVLLLGSIFAVFGSACTNLMIVYGLTYLRLVRAIYGLVINFILNLLLIPKYGVIGAAFASLISQVFAAWLSNAFNKRTVESFKWQTETVFTLGIPGGVKLISVLLRKRMGVNEK